MRLKQTQHNDMNRVESFFLTEQRGQQQKRWQSYLKIANIVFSLPAALALGIWGIYFFIHWYHTENVPGCNSKFVVDISLAVSVIDMFSVSSIVFGVFYQRYAEKSTSENIKQQYGMYKKVDTVTGVVVNIILVILKNVMFYYLWLSDCEEKSNPFYQAAHHFMIGIIVRVCISSTFIGCAFCCGLLGDYILKKVNPREEILDDIMANEAELKPATAPSTDSISTDEELFRASIQEDEHQTKSDVNV